MPKVFRHRAPASMAQVTKSAPDRCVSAQHTLWSRTSRAGTADQCNLAWAPHAAGRKYRSEEPTAWGSVL